jgi:hypothetical protein
MDYANHGMRFLLELAALGSLAPKASNPTTDPQRLPQANWRIDWVLYAQSMRHLPRRTCSMP